MLFHLYVCIGDEVPSRIDRPNPKNGFPPKVWGPALWFYMHILAANYDPKNKEEYRKMFESIKRTLPCSECREAAVNNYRLNGFESDGWGSSREQMQDFVYNLQNFVGNETYGCKYTAPNRSNVKSFFERLRSSDGKPMDLATFIKIKKSEGDECKRCKFKMSVR